MIRANEVQHLTAGQRNQIRYHVRATEQGIARKFGVSVKSVRLVRANAQPQHPARVAAIQRRDSRIRAVVVVDASGAVVSKTVVPQHYADPAGAGGGGRGGGTIKRTLIPAAALSAPGGQLHVEGGADLPQPLG